jgi:dynein assembly factor 6, axonemal
VDDDRPSPEYEFAYKQAVQTTDAFLGMDPLGKDPTSTSCEDLLLHVTLPEAASAADVDVDLKPTWVVVRTHAQCAPNSLL